MKRKNIRKVNAMADSIVNAITYIRQKKYHFGDVDDKIKKLSADRNKNAKFVKENVQDLSGLLSELKDMRGKSDDLAPKVQKFFGESKSKSKKVESKSKKAEKTEKKTDSKNDKIVAGQKIQLLPPDEVCCPDTDEGEETILVTSEDGMWGCGKIIKD